MDDPPLQLPPSTPDYSSSIPASPLETTKGDATARSPRDLKGVDINLTTDEILNLVREGYKRIG